MKKNTTNIKILVLFLSMILLGGIITFNVLFTTLTGIHLRSGINVLEAKSNFQQTTTTIVAKRGLIKDREGQTIAQNQETYKIVAVLSEDRIGDYAYVKDKEFTAKALAPILGMSEQTILNYLNVDAYQTYLGSKGSNLTIDQKKQIESIVYTPDMTKPEKTIKGLPGIEFEKTVNRVYTPGKFSSTLLGFASYNSEKGRVVGQVGIEAYWDKELTGTNGKAVSKKDGLGYTIPGTYQIVETATNGNDIYLTIDKDVQEALEATLEKTVTEIGAKNAWAIVMEVETGKILGYGGFPTYDLNSREEVLYFDMPSMFTFEPGSVMKPFTYAIAMEEDVYKGDALVETGKFCIAYNEDYTEIHRKNGDCSVNGNINDANRKGWGKITIDDGLLRSSNTVIATILTEYLKTNVFWEYIDKLGFFKQTGIEGLEFSEERGLKNNTYAIDKLTFGFGQGSSVTALQLMQAYTAILNDGYEIKPYYIDKIVDASNNIVYEGKTTYLHTDENNNPVRVFSSETCKQVMNLMKGVVQSEIGTGKGYNIEGFDMIAKTGTGEIADAGSYEDSIYTSSIMAAAPSDDPKIMVYYAFQSPYVGTFDKSYFKSLFTAAYEAVGIKQTNTSDSNTNYENWQEFEMPALKNHTVQYAQQKLEKLEVHKIYIGDGNMVLDQYPSSNEKTSTNQNVFIKTNSTNITLPNMINWSYKDVMIYKEMSGLNIVCNGSGVVKSQSVAAKTLVTNETEIIVTLE